jgi:hypothetical protein
MAIFKCLFYAFAMYEFILIIQKIILLYFWGHLIQLLKCAVLEMQNL